jgi:type VI secretion system secreted protein Hcp
MAVGGSASLNAAMAIFLDLGPDIPGESTDSVYAGKVDVLSWSWGVSNSGSAHAGGGGGAGKANFQNLSLTKYVDKASPQLMLRCANGAHIPKATLIVRKAGTPPIEFLKIELTEVLVASVSTGGSGGEDRLTENVVFDFAQLSLTYTPVLSALPQTGLSFGWDIPANTGTNGTVVAPTPQPVVGLTATLTYANGAPVARLTWMSTAGASYQVWVASDLNAPFQRYGNPTPSAGDGTTSLTMPADAVRKFFRIETLSAP